jgi:hypothetical protein
VEGQPVSLDATRWAWLQQIAGPPGVKLVLLSLADRADEYHRCYPSIARLVKDTGMHRDTVFASIERLEKAGLLTVDRRNGAGNVYTLVGVDSRENQSEKSYRSSTRKPVGKIRPVGKSDPSEISANQSEKSDLNQSEKSDPEPTNEPIKNLKTPHTPHPGFDDFWAVYPHKVRKQDAAKAWQRHRPDADTLIADIAARLRAGAWLADEVQFIPHPATYLNGHRWTDAIIPRRTSHATDRPDRNSGEDRSAAGRVRANVARDRAARAAAVAGGIGLAADGLDVRPPLDVEFRRLG